MWIIKERNIVGSVEKHWNMTNLYKYFPMLLWNSKNYKLSEVLNVKIQKNFEED